MAPISVTHTRLLNQPALHLRSPDGAEASVLLYGGHVVSFRPAGGAEVLYLSPLATTEGGAAVRGGIPLIFPQFDRRGPLPQVPRHGFARTTLFEHAETSAEGVRLTLRDSADTRATFPHSFGLTLDVRLAARQLAIGLRIENLSEAPMPFTCALHTYLRVAEIDQVTISGLSGRHFEDKVMGGATATAGDDVLRIEGEVDRIYGHVDDLVMHDGERSVRVAQDGFTDAVIWNPGPTLARGMADLPDDAYRHMVCVEAARALVPVVLPGRGTFEGWQTLSVEAHPSDPSR